MIQNAEIVGIHSAIVHIFHQSKTQKNVVHDFICDMPSYPMGFEDVYFTW